MADVTGPAFFGAIKKLFKDMEDGSYAEVVVVGEGTEEIGRVSDPSAETLSEEVLIELRQARGGTKGTRRSEWTGDRIYSRAG